MLTNTDIADVPSEMATQRTIASLGLSIGQYLKTLQGKQMVESQELFVLNGTLYQGFNQMAVETNWNQCSPEEVANAHDVDGTKSRVVATRERALAGAAQAKDKEHGERKRLKIAQERDELELALLKQKMGMLTEKEPEPEPEPKIHACAACGKTFDAANKLNAHRMGAKH